MVKSDDIYSLADFRENPRKHIRRLTRTRRPQLLTLDGKPAAVMQDAKSYEKLQQRLRRLETLEGIERGLKSMNKGEGKPLRKSFTAIAARLGADFDR